MYCGGSLLPGSSVWVEMPVNCCAAMTAPPIQAGQPATRMVITAQYHGQKPFGSRSAKNDRPVFMLYLIPLVDQGRLEYNRDQHQPVHVKGSAGADVRQQASPPPTEMPKLIAWWPSIAIMPARVRGTDPAPCASAVRHVPTPRQP